MLDDLILLLNSFIGACIIDFIDFSFMILTFKKFNILLYGFRSYSWYYLTKSYDLIFLNLYY